MRSSRGRGSRTLGRRAQGNHPRRRARARLGCHRAAGGGRRVADGGLGAEPGRSRDCTRRPGGAGGRCRRPAGCDGRRRRRLAVLHPRLHATPGSAARRPGRRPRGAGPARAAGCCSTSSPTTSRRTTPGLPAIPSTSSGAREPISRATPEPGSRQPAGSTRAAVIPTSRPGPTSCSSIRCRHRLRDAVVATLGDIAGQCDGVRCDMAMLLLDDCRQRTWRGRLEPVRERPYWSEVTSRVRATHPGFTFLAEAYGDHEVPSPRQGIDACYDKRLYDRLRDGDAASVRAHLARRPVSAGPPRPLPREPRRAPRGGRVHPCAGCARRASPCSPCPARCCCTRASSRACGPAAGPARPPAARAARRGRARLLVGPPRRRLARAPARGRLAPARGDRLARQSELPEPAGLALGAASGRSSTTRRGGRRARRSSAPSGPGSRGDCRTCSAASRYRRDGDELAARGLYVALPAVRSPRVQPPPERGEPTSTAERVPLERP